MDIELRYQAAIKKYNLNIKDLPEDARDGIREMENILKAVALNERKEKKINPDTFKKIKRLDKWILFEIYDHVNETDENEEEKPDAEQVIEEIEETAASEEAEEKENEDQDDTTEKKKQGDTKTGELIDAALEVAYKSGKTKFSLDDIKAISKPAYAAIFDGYDESGDNGIETSNFRLIETDENIYTLSKV